MNVTRRGFLSLLGTAAAVAISNPTLAISEVLDTTAKSVDPRTDPSITLAKITESELSILEQLIRDTKNVLMQLVGGINDEATRMIAKDSMDKVLDKYSDHFIEKVVICDESNNSPTSIDNSEFRMTLMLRDTNSLDYIRLDPVLKVSGLEFESV